MRGLIATHKRTQLREIKDFVMTPERWQAVKNKRARIRELPERHSILFVDDECAKYPGLVVVRIYSPDYERVPVGKGVPEVVATIEEVK